MDPTLAPPALLEQQISLLQKLAESLAQAQRALLQSDIPELAEHTILQSSLCEQLHGLYKRSSVTTLSGADPRRRELSQRLIEAERQVRYLNGVYGALLRRAARSVQITQNLYRSVRGTYDAPCCQGPGVSPERSS